MLIIAPPSGLEPSPRCRKNLANMGRPRHGKPRHVLPQHPQKANIKIKHTKDNPNKVNITLSGFSLPSIPAQQTIPPKTKKIMLNIKQISLILSYHYWYIIFRTSTTWTAGCTLVKGGVFLTAFARIHFTR